MLLKNEGMLPLKCKKAGALRLGRACRSRAARCSSTARAKNLGNFAGKEVLQVYAGIPRGETKRLVCFGKTDVVGVGDEYKLILSFPVRDLAIYDEARSAYILAAGEYPVFVGGSSDALTPVALLRVGEERLVEQCAPRLSLPRGIPRTQPARPCRKTI